MDAPSAATPARLLYTAGARRSIYVRYLLRAILGMLASVALAVVLMRAGEHGLIGPLLVNLTLLVCFALGVWFAVRTVMQIVHLLFRRSASVRLYDKGFVWFEGKKAARHRWGEIVRFRQGARALRLFGHTWLEWGAQVITVEDGSEFRFRPAMGDTEVFAQYVRPYSARVTSLRMGKALRAEQPVKLSDRLTIYPGGVALGKTEIPWAELRVTVDPDWSRITLRRLRSGMKPKVLARFHISEIDNAGGFVEIARPQIESFSQRLP